MGDPAAKQKLEQAIAALEEQRSVLGDAIEPALAALQTQLADLTATEQAVEDQRKQITVVFADVKGFTAMSQTMDPEDVAGIMNDLWAKVDDAIASHGGKVDKHIGDAVMAVFGAPVAREDDPERAILAALAMQEAVDKALAGHENADVGALQMRVGINTGVAMLGTVGSTDEYTAIGHTVNLASRLEGQAPPGGILISYATMKHVRGLFDIEAVAPLTVKGVEQPVQAFVVKRAKARIFRVATREVAGVETETVGRSQELARITSLLPETPNAEPKPVNVVTIVGAPGIGKSRMMYEIFNFLEAQPHPVWLFRGRAVESGRDVPYGLMRHMILDRFLINGSDPPAAAKQKLETGLEFYAGDVGQSAAPYVGHLIGFDYLDHPAVHGLLSEPRVIRDHAFQALAQMMHLGRDDRYVVLLIEDIHWADPDSLDLLEYIAAKCADIPLLIVATARPDVYDTRSSWGDATNHATERLEPLPEAVADELIDEVLQRVADPPAGLHDLIAQRSEGNPFYVEELVKMLIDDGVIDASDDTWRVDMTRLDEARVPDTLTGVLQARIDALTRPERRAIQRASVIGRIYWEAAVDHLAAVIAPDEDVERLTDVAQTLERREFSYGRPNSAFADTREFIFKHAVLQDVAYETVIKRIRTPYHAAAAGWLIEAAGDRAGEFAAEIADHFDRAGESVPAVEWLVMAGDQARRTYSPEAASRAYSRALEIAERSPAGHLSEHRIAALEGLGDSLTVQGRYDEAIDTYRQMFSEAGSAHDDLAQARADRGLAAAQTFRGEFREALESAERSAVAARRGSGRLEEAKALWMQAWSRLRLGLLDDISELADRVTALSRDVDDEAQLARALNLAGVVAHSTGSYDDAVDSFEESAGIFERLGNPEEVMPLLNNIGVISEAKGDYVDAEKRYSEALAIAQETGNRDGQMAFRSNLGGTRVALGRFEEGEADLRTVIEMASAGLDVLPETYRFLAEALLGQGRLDEALDAAVQSLELAVESEAPDYTLSAWRVLGTVASHLDHSIVIDRRNVQGTYLPEECFERSLGIAQEIESAGEEARTLAAWAIHDGANSRTTPSSERWELARTKLSELGAEREIDRLEEMLRAPARRTSGR